MNTTRTLRTLSAISLSFTAAMACLPQQAAPAEAPPAPPVAYQPNWTYNTTARSEKLDVTLGIIAPQFSTGAQLYQQANRTDNTVKQMLSAMQATFNEVLVAKGFNTTGPFGSLDEMTFPDKQGTNLVLYPEFDFQVEVRMENHRSKAPPAAEPAKNPLGIKLGTPPAKPAPEQPAAVVPQIPVCDAVVTVTGNMLFVAQEPLSKQRMWIKKLDMSAADQTFPGQEGDICDGKREHWSHDIEDAWAKAHEAVFQNGMKAFDSYVDGDEFKMLKEQSIAARERTTYGG